MKKGIAAILLFLYFAFSTGVVISYHFCMDEFDSLQLGNERSDICGKCGMHTEDFGCCSDRVKIFKIQDDQLASAVQFKFDVPETIVEPFAGWDEAAPECIHPLFVYNHSPPLSKQDTYLQNCVFRI